MLRTGTSSSSSSPLSSPCSCTATTAMTATASSSSARFIARATDTARAARAARRITATRGAVTSRATRERSTASGVLAPRNSFLFFFTSARYLQRTRPGSISATRDATMCTIVYIFLRKVHVDLVFGLVWFGIMTTYSRLHKTIFYPSCRAGRRRRFPRLDILDL
jgi:hypothetical protein